MAPIQDSDSESLFHLEKISQWVSLPPASLGNPLPALCASFFSPLLLSYYPPAGGIVLAWQDVELSDSPPASATQSASSKSKSKSKSQSQKKAQTAQDESDISESESETEDAAEGYPLLLKVVDEYSAPFLWATATLLVFRPKKNAWIEARITSQSATHITLSYLNAFSISVIRAHLPADWTWCAASMGGYSMTGGRRESAGVTEGYWMDGDGMPIGAEARVRITDWDAKNEAKAGRGHLRIEGSLVEEGAESQGQGERERQKAKPKAKSALRRSQNAESSGQANTEAMEVQ
jgi:DNA-directed RNA polymerase I subunit RPA43